MSKPESQVNTDLVHAVASHIPEAVYAAHAAAPRKLGATGIDLSGLANKIIASLPEALVVLEGSGILSGTPDQIAKMVVSLIGVFGKHGVLPTS